MRPSIFLVVLLSLSAGCRAQRTWFGTVGATRGATCETWVATIADDIQQETFTDNCSASLGDVDDGISVSMLESDTWAGECWALLSINVATNAPDRATANVNFAFDLCNDAGEDCPVALADQVQVRPVVIAADVLDGTFSVPEGCEN